MVVGWRLGAVAWARMFAALLEARGVERRDGPKGKDDNSASVAEIAADAFKAQELGFESCSGPRR